jgi:molybdopterin converting factor small subunit
MKIEVVALATLRQFMPDVPLGGARSMEVAPGTTMLQLRDMVGLPADEVRVIIRNHRQAELDDVVQDGDRVAFIPAVAGG